jgi:integrase
VLTIRDSKGGKDRQVPVSAPLRERLAAYHAQIAGRTGGDWFFTGRKGLPLTLMNVSGNFRRFLRQARIPRGGRGHGPRVHDLRHYADGRVMCPAVAFPLLGAAELVLQSA